MIEETGATAPWAGFNVMLAANMLREAAAMTTQISGEIIPSDKPGSLAMGDPPGGRRLRRHRALECAGHPRHARRRHAARLRQHGGAQGLRDVPRHAPADRPGACRRQACPNGVINVITNDPKDAAEVVEALIAASGRQARQLHRLDQGRQDHRRAGRPAPEAGAARARRQGAAGRARRRRYRRRGQRRGLRRLHEPGPDLHVDRAADRRREDRRRVRRQARGPRRRSCRPAIRAAMSCWAR